MVALANARMIIGNQATKYLRYTCLSCSSESAPFLRCAGRSSHPPRLQPLVGVDGPQEAPKSPDTAPATPACVWITARYAPCRSFLKICSTRNGALLVRVIALLI